MQQIVNKSHKISATGKPFDEMFTALNGQYPTMENTPEAEYGTMIQLFGIIECVQELLTRKRKRWAKYDLFDSENTKISLSRKMYDLYPVL